MVRQVESYLGCLTTMTRVVSCRGILLFVCMSVCKVKPCLQLLYVRNHVDIWYSYALDLEVSQTHIEDQGMSVLHYFMHESLNGFWLLHFIIPVPNTCLKNLRNQIILTLYVLPSFFHDRLYAVWQLSMCSWFCFRLSR